MVSVNRAMQQRPCVVGTRNAVSWEEKERGEGLGGRQEGRNYDGEDKVKVN
jgi:hypothetical protein